MRSKKAYYFVTSVSSVSTTIACSVNDALPYRAMILLHVGCTYCWFDPSCNAYVCICITFDLFVSCVPLYSYCLTFFHLIFYDAVGVLEKNRLYAWYAWCETSISIFISILFELCSNGLFAQNLYFLSVIVGKQLEVYQKPKKVNKNLKHLGGEAGIQTLF